MGLEQSIIISALSKGFNRELTINQLSKSIKKSYAFTNQHAHSLIKKDILTKKAVGSAILCLLNYRNEETLAHLIFNSIKNRKQFIDSIGEHKKTALEGFLANTHAHIIFLENSTITVVSDEKHTAKLVGFTIKNISLSEFNNSAKKINFEELIVLANHESFWRGISRIA